MKKPEDNYFKLSKFARTNWIEALRGKYSFSVNQNVLNELKQKISTNEKIFLVFGGNISIF